MVEEKEKVEEKQQEEKEDMLTKAWDKLFYEGICDEFMFWCKGFTREKDHVALVDAVIAEPGAPKKDWRFEGNVEVTGPVLIHPIVK